MERRGRSTPKISKCGSSIFTDESIGERTEQNHPNELGFPSSMASCDPSGSRHLIEFGRYAAERRSKRGDGPFKTFDFLGFTHACGTTRKGDFTIKRISAMKKVRGKLKELKDKLKRMMHSDLAAVGSWLSSVFRGWCQYHAIPGNSKRLQQFRTALQDLWYRVLRRRSQRGGRMPWPKFSRLSRRWLPSPKILHPYPNVRFARLYPR